MAWTPPRTWVSGETVTAALMNTHVRDNFNMTAPAVVTTKGDLVAATAANTITRLAVGVNGNILVADSAATPGVRWSNTSKTASAGTGISIGLDPTITAAANSDALYALNINSTFAKGAFTGLSAYGIVVQPFGQSGAGTVTTAIGLLVSSPGIGTTNYAIYAATGNVVFAGDAAANVFIRDTSNANMTTGLTINQGAADDEILALKSSDVAHGMTTLTETDTYGELKKNAAASGTLSISGYNSSSGPGLMLRGNLVTGDTTKSIAGNGAIMIKAGEKSGTDITTLAANENILAVQNYTTTRFILDGDGDSHQDVGTAWTNFDHEDDIALLNTLAAHVTRRDDPLRRGFGKWLHKKRGRLEELKLATFNRDGHHFVNMSRLTMLHTGALRALGAKLEAQAERLLQLENKVLQLSA